MGSRQTGGRDFTYAFADFGTVIEAFELEDSRGELKTCEESEWPIADGVLIALRQAYSRTYPDRSWQPSPGWNKETKESLAEIQKLALAALRPLKKELARLKLDPVGSDKEDEEPAVFKFVIAPVGKLRRKVTVGDSPEKVPLIEAAGWKAADPAISALRQVLSLTFSEAFTLAELSRVMERIRRIAATTLVEYNDLLEAIELEPVSMPRFWTTRRERPAKRPSVDSSPTQSSDRPTEAPRGHGRGQAPQESPPPLDLKPPQATVRTRDDGGSSRS